jgi:hypothetical protein
MNRKVTVTYDLPEEICLVLEQRAAAEGRRWEEVVAEHVARCRPSHRQLVPEEIERLAMAFERHFGEFHSGDPNFSNNERVEADQAEHYGRRTQRDGRS